MTCRLSPSSSVRYSLTETGSLACRSVKKKSISMAVSRRAQSRGCSSLYCRCRFTVSHSDSMIENTTVSR